jgi:spermidine synthase
MRWWIWGVAMVMAACSPRQHAENKEAPRAALVDSTPAPARVADAVLAERAGLQGPIRIEQRGGRRLLIIDDVIHASVPWSASGPDATARDPLVGLLHLLRPGAKTCLVIGLGSGRTASELAQAGITVTAVELEPAVIELARTYFDYRGTAIAADGLAHLRASATAYDLVLMDAFAGTRPPPALVTPDALALLRQRTAPGGITAVRMLATPHDPVVDATARGLARTAGTHYYQQLLGSGLGGESQNLYLLASDAPLSWRSDTGLALWPVLGDGARSAEREPAAGLARKVTIVGYLHRTADGVLAIDLAHWEMGAARYLVAHAPDRLGAALPAAARFPTQGDIASDGDTSATLRGLLGGGGVKRSDVRFSPVVAAVTGTARLISVIHPDAASGLPAAMRGPVVDDRLPYGGALYELDVTEVHWTLGGSGAQDILQAVTAALATAAKQASTGDLAAAVSALGKAVDAFEPLGAQAALVPTRRRIVALRDAGIAETHEMQRGAFAAAAACDRMRERIVRDDPDGALLALRHGFEDCAVVGYEHVTARDRTAAGEDAAARLLYLLDPARREAASAAARSRVRLCAKVQSQFHVLPQLFPPRWVEQQRAPDAVQGGTERDHR